jgi:Tfp pilus assembly protein FimT
VELVIAVAVILVISAVALPSLTRTVRNYQLNDAAVRLAGVLKFTRFEAIRRNSPINCVNAQGGANAPANVWSDDNGDGVEQPTENQIVLGSNNTLVPAGAVPSTGTLAAAVGAGPLTAANPSNNNVRFDQRGGVVPPTAYVFYVGNTTTPESGFRAVIVLPSGTVQVWSYPGAAGSTWHKIS